MYDLLIIYIDGTKHVVKGVSEYGLLDDNMAFYFAKNGFRNFVPTANIMFFGKGDDYYNE